MVLGEGGQLVCVNAPDWRTKVARESRQKAWDMGRAPLLKKDIYLAQLMAGKVFEHHIAGKLLQDGSAELSGYWHDEATGVRLRCRPDFMPHNMPAGRPLIVEYKTSQSANPRRFAKTMADYGYHQQAAWNLDGIAACCGVQDAAFVFIVQQKDPPWLVSVCQVEPEDIARGRAQNRQAIDTYAQCRESGIWPGYDGLYTIALPGWARHQIEDDLTCP
jgi:PDDEXK-like domain of unknown function (DUF3799)